MTYEDGKLVDSIQGSKKPASNSRFMEGDQMVQVRLVENNFGLLT